MELNQTTENKDKMYKQVSCCLLEKILMVKYEDSPGNLL